MNQEFGDDVTVLGRCERCEAPTSRYYNCANLACRALTLLCDDCAPTADAAQCGPAHANAPRAKSAAHTSNCHSVVTNLGVSAWYY